MALMPDNSTQIIVLNLGDLWGMGCGDLPVGLI